MAFNLTPGYCKPFFHFSISLFCWSHFLNVCLYFGWQLLNSCSQLGPRSKTGKQCTWRETIVHLLTRKPIPWTSGILHGWAPLRWVSFLHVNVDTLTDQWPLTLQPPISYHIVFPKKKKWCHFHKGVARFRKSQFISDCSAEDPINFEEWETIAVTSKLQHCYIVWSLF